MGKNIEPTELDFLLRYPAVLNVTSPVDFLSHGCWGGIKALSNMEQFRNLDKDIEVHMRSTVTIMGYRHILVTTFSCLTPFRDLLSGGKSSQTANVQRRRNFLENGRTRTHCKGCA